MTRLLENALFGTALILAAAVLRRALKGRLLPGARLALWAACLFRLLAPAFPTSGLSLWGLLPRAGEALAATPGIDSLPLPGGTVSDVPAANLPAGAANPVLPAAGAAFSWEMVLPAVWIGVGALLAVRYALAYARTRRAVADAIPLGRDDPRYALLPRCARLREGVMDGAPLTFGAVRPTVVVPPGLSGGALDCVLAHEGVHARRRDNLWHYAMALALAVYWWDPAVWLMARLLRRDIELACDRAAVRKLGADRRAEYAETLVALATAGAEPAFCRTFGRKAAEERILSVMKFKKTTVLGVVLSLVLVAGVTAAFASGPKAPEVPDEDSTTSTAPSISAWRMSTDANNALKYFAVNIGYLEDQLAQRVTGGSMTQAEADRIAEQARALSGNGEELEWVFQENSGLVHDNFDEDGNYRPGFNIFYKDEEGKLIPVDPATVVSGFILPAAEKNGWAEVVVYRGRAYNRADLSAGTLEWLDWYMALPWEERLAVSYVPAELQDGEAPAGTEAEQPAAGFVPDYDPSTEDSAGTGDEPAIGELESSFYDYPVADASGVAVAGAAACPVAGCTEVTAHQHDGRWYCFMHPVCPVEGCTAAGEHVHDGVVYSCNGAGHSVDGGCNGSCAIPLCPVEGCTVRGRHIHDGEVYRCGGDVCDGSCLVYGGGAEPIACPPETIDQNFPSAAPVSGGHHSDSHHGNGYQGGHH